MSSLKNDNKFRSGPKKRLLTKGMFYDFDPDTGGEYSFMWLDDVRKRYLELSDPTEYKIAYEMFENFEHWQLMCNLNWFKAEVDAWRAELAVKLQAEGLALCGEGILLLI